GTLHSVATGTNFTTSNKLRCKNRESFQLLTCPFIRKVRLTKPSKTQVLVLCKEESGLIPLQADDGEKSLKWRRRRRIMKKGKMGCFDLLQKGRREERVLGFQC
ncbi:hypothetical protein LINGRAPRIM_LOCUS979, partial [Linum grandiflorum]